MSLDRTDSASAPLYTGPRVTNSQPWSQHDSNTRQSGTAAKWRLWGIAAVNAWLIFHLLAIVIAPWSVPPSSRMVRNAWRAIGPYVQALYLNHGYHYFAPEPGSSTLVSYSFDMPDGSQRTGKIPNRQIHPRLLYHRHFMLTEYLGSGTLSNEQKSAFVEAMARELCRENGARRVSLSQMTHRLPSMQRIRAGATLDDPESFTEEPLGTFSWAP